ncbi:histidine phosphatase family protein [uncultured Chitinophaga sp.]|uniref:SixA phosphatase family protein n=1 Tax=uncultured Chitinophaga sp. TaxID=339340 RepID=UPI0026046AAD|nr:histidine phosphatase family protein [uncultured Chitinophaga sp.]
MKTLGKYVALLCLVLMACESKPVRQPVPLTEDSTFLTGTFFLVRHAEKHPGADSTLTQEGHVRAHHLYTLLEDSGLQKIYFTPFKRTVQTADPLFEHLHLDTAYYMPDTTGESLIYEITRREDWGKRLLIVGHSNTLLPIMRALKAKPPVDSIGDKDYNNLFIIYKHRDAVKVHWQKFN